MTLGVILAAIILLTCVAALFGPTGPTWGGPAFWAVIVLALVVIGGVGVGIVLAVFTFPRR